MEYQFLIDYLTPDGALIAQRPIDPDFEPAFEWTAFEGIRRGRLPAIDARPHGVIEPLWNQAVGEPYMRGFRAIVAAHDGHFAEEFSTGYIRSTAQLGASGLIEEGLLSAGDTFRYAVSAVPASSHHALGGFRIEDEPVPLQVRDTALPTWQARSRFEGEGDPSDFQVFVTANVVADLIRQAEAAKTVETGGVLLGELMRDRSSGEIFLAISDYLAAQHTVAEATRLQFTAETWAAVDTAIAERGGGCRGGWAHFHPDFCGIRGCPAERRAQCTQSSDFFSAEDVHLHRVCFSRAYHVALLVSDKLERGMNVSAYGWRKGVVARRGYFVTEEGFDATRW